MSAVRYIKAAIVCLTVSVLLIPIQAYGQNRYRVNVIKVSNAETKIRVSEVSVLDQLSTSYECIGFANDGDRVVNAVRFRFTYVDAARHVDGSDTLERRGPFRPGAVENVPKVVEGKRYEYGALERVPNCQHFRYPNDNIAYLIATVDRVEFADGAVWEDVNPPSASPVASPSPTAAASR